MDLLETLAIIFELVQLLIKSAVVIFQGFLSFVIPNSRKCIENEVVLITGAGHGLGRELAIIIAELGAKVVLWDINEEFNNAVAKEIKSKKGMVYSYQCDITNEKQVESQAHRVRQEVGDVTILINNAGILHGQPLMCLNNLQIRRTLEINLLGYFWTTREFLPRMMELYNGHIVGVSSVAGVVGQVNMTDYSASKFGIVGFMESLEEELYLLNKDHCIHLTTVFPLTMNTGLSQQPTSRFPRLLPILKVETAAKDIVDGILRNRRYVYVPSRVGFMVYISRLFPKKVTSMFNRFLGYAVAPNTNVSINTTTTMRRRMIT